MIHHRKRGTFEKYRPTLREVVFGSAIALGVFGVLVLIWMAALPDEMAADDTAINLTGEWEGMLVLDYNDNERYDYTMTLQQTGRVITGKTTQAENRQTQPRIVRAHVLGTLDNGNFVFEETRFTQFDGIVPQRWCRMEAALEYERDAKHDTLTGTWTGLPTEGVIGTCEGTEGRIVLTRRHKTP